MVDCHTHSAFSPDAADSAEEMCRRAALLGLSAYALTDHCDCNLHLTAEEWERENGRKITVDREMYGAGVYARESIKTVSALKERYPFLICGIELGQPLQEPQFAEEIRGMEQLDFIIGSQHMNRGCDDFYWIKYNELGKNDIDRLLEDYFVQILEMCRAGGFDVLGHLTYPLRYIEGEHKITVNMRRYEDIIEEIFKALITGGRGIEINTSGLRQKYGKMLPDERYVRRFRELGGEILTLGSDAHKADDIGKGIAEGAELARECGFKYTAYFRRRRAEFLAL